MQTDLLTIPGVGKKMKEHLINIGIKVVENLKGQDPEALYARDCVFKGFKEDLCVLYVYRLAVYFAENEIHEPEKLKWWNWKDVNENQ